MLISTIMTWALTKPLDPADPNLPFTEADYRKRKPHPNYKEHLRCEREVVTVKKRANLKSNLKTLVVCCGVTYGEKQGPLHHLFKMAWQTAPFLPIFGKGSNKVPLLHVRDLAALGTGKVKSVTKQEALLLPEVSQRAYDMMTVDLNIDSVYIIDRIRWRFDMPFRDVVDDVVREYKAARNLRPVKIIVLGPPASGKTRLARFLADHYGINYVHVKTLISDTIQRLIDDIEAARSGGGQRDDLEDTAEDADNDKENEEEAEEEEEQEVEEQDEKEIVASRVELQEQLDEIRTNLAANNGRLDDVVLNKLFLKRLKSKDCLNQGYVIDGHPKTLEQARMLFLINEEDPRGEHVEKLEDESEDEDAAEEAKNVDVTILPELVVVLEASDHFLKERVMNRPESEIQGTHYTEECMLRRMKEYRERNTDDNTPLQLFDEMEIYTLVIPVEADVCPDMFPTFYQCAEILGEPRNYEPTAEEMETRRKRIEAEAQAAEAAEKLRREREMLERERQREEKMMEWERLTEKLKQEEEERLCVLAEPLRHYLATHVLPTLTEALIEVAKLRPQDPLDFLAEYLFRKNPEGRMFEPDYTETMSMLLDTISRQRNHVLPVKGPDVDVAQFTRRSQDELSAAGETEKSEDERRETSAISTAEQPFEYNWTDGSEKGELDFAGRVTEEFRNGV
ncbi:Putative adenylate kinase 7 [Harpegnathos saltator]|uniref:Putative adenylate kinase 7 n=1 Tax=Harpegnathos saltator TaxID=610380 RepID=E2BB39_HARSA|nr:Putative adenylate kinase 7 [Harpegnathos saltator]